MPESNLAQNVITPWAYNLYGMMNPYAYGVPNPFNPMNDYGRTPPPVGGVNIPSWILNGTAPGAPSPGGGITPFTGGAPGAPAGAPTGADPSGYLTNQYYNMYQNLGFNRGFQAAQSPEEILGRAAMSQRFGMANADYNRFFGLDVQGPGSNPTATRWMNRGMGGFDANGDYIGGANSGTYNTALGNLGIIKDGGAFAGYNDPKKWADSLQDYGKYAQNMMLDTNPYRDPSSWSDAIVPINVQGVSDANAVVQQAPGEAMKALSGLNDYSRALAQDPTKASSAMGNSILPLATWRQGETNNNFNNAMSQMGQAVNPYLDSRLDQATGAWQKGNDAGFRIAQQRDQMGYDPNALAQRGVADVIGQNNQYADALMRNIDAESRRSLATQTPEVAAAMAAAGYGESGAGQAAMGNLVSSILEKANQDKQSTLANLTESNLGRQAQAIGQRTSVGAQNASDVLNTQASMYQNAYNQREQARNLAMQLGAGSAGDIMKQAFGAREASNDLMYQTAAGLQGQAFMGAQNDKGNLLQAQYGATANNVGAMQQQAWQARNQMLGQQYDRTTGIIQAGIQNNQQMRQQLGNTLFNASANLLGQGLQANNDRGNLLAQLQNNALFQAEESQRQRAMSQLQANSTGQDMQMKMWQANQANYTDRLNQALSMGRSYQDYEQQYRNQIAEQLLMPFKTGLQVTTGINTSPVPANYRVNPLTNAGIQVGSNVLSGMFGGNGNNDAVNPYAY